MKICQQCGKENQDHSKFCMVCGNNLENMAPTQVQQEYNNQQNSYQTHRPIKQRNVWIAPILDVIGGVLLYILCGIGQLYLGLYKRGIVLCLLGFVPMGIGLVVLSSSEFMGSLVSLIIGLALTLYSAYDAHICTKAMNEGKDIPLLFNNYDIK